MTLLHLALQLALFAARSEEPDTRSVLRSSLADRCEMVDSVLKTAGDIRKGRQTISVPPYLQAFAVRKTATIEGRVVVWALVNHGPRAESVEPLFGGAEQCTQKEFRVVDRLESRRGDLPEAVVRVEFLSNSKSGKAIPFVARLLTVRYPPGVEGAAKIRDARIGTMRRIGDRWLAKLKSNWDGT